MIITCSLKLSVCLFLEFETFSGYPLTAGQCPSPLGVLQICLQRQMASSLQSLSTNPFFLSFSTTVLLDLQLNLFFLNVVNVVSVHKNAFILPCLRVTGLSGQADANLYPVQSRPSPSCPKVYLSACVSSPAVALAS